MILLFHTADNFVCSIAYQALLNGKNIYTAFYWIIQIILLIYVVTDLRKYNKLAGFSKMQKSCRNW